MGLFSRRNKPEPPPSWAAFFQSADRYERFESLVRAHFKDRGIKVLITDGIVRAAPGSPQGWSGEMGLTNVGQWCARSEESDWPRFIGIHFEKLQRGQVDREEIEATASDYAANAPRLVPRLYEADNLPAKVLDASVCRNDIPGLVTVLCLDMPDSVYTVQRAKADMWKTPDDELFARAIANLNTLADAQLQQFDLDGKAKIYLLGGNSFFNASLILTPARLDPFMAKHGCFVSPHPPPPPRTPPRRSLRLEHPRPLIHLTIRFEADGPGSLSRRVWWMRADERIEIPYSMTDAKIEVSPPQEFLRVMKLTE